MHSKFFWAKSLIVFFCCWAAHGQVVPIPTPDVAALLKVQGTEVNESNGVANVSIPLHVIDVDNVNIPLTLTYDSKGVKVEEVASNVGTSWTLTGGSLISRKIYGMPDEFQKKLVFGNATINTPTYPLNCISLLTYAGYGWVDNAVESMNAAAYFLANGVMAGYQGSYKNEFHEKEPDVFTYILPNGRQGTFMIQSYGNIISSGNDKIYLYLENGLISKFTVTDEYGNTYYFDIIEKRVNTIYDYLYGELVSSGPYDYFESVIDYNTNTTGYCEQSSGNNSSDGTEWFNKPTYVSWYLSKIVTSNQKTITYSYQDEYHSRLSITTNIYSGRGYANSVGGVSKFKNTNSEERFNTKRIIKIDYPSGSVNISYQPVKREDVSGTNPSFMLDGVLTMAMAAVKSIDVRDKNNQVVKNIQLLTSYRETLPINGATVAYYERRLWLDKVVVNDAVYELVYNPDLLPNRFSKEQDYWGYFNANGSDANENSLIPDVWFYPEDPRTYTRPTNFSIFRRSTYVGTEMKISSANAVFNNTNLTGKVSNRDVNPTALQTGMLEKIIYPTKGYEKFYYEPNDFLYENELRQGFGLRVKSIERYDSDNSLQVTTNYSYKNADGSSSGVVTEIPVFGRLETLLNMTTPYTYTVRSSSLSGDGSLHYARVEKNNPGNGRIVSEYFIPYTIETTTGLLSVSTPTLYLKNTDGAKLRIDCQNCGLGYMVDPINTREYEPAPLARNLENLFGNKKNELIYDQNNNLLSKREIQHFISNTSKRIDVFFGLTPNQNQYESWSHYNISYTFGRLNRGIDKLTTYLTGQPYVNETKYTYDNNLVVKTETTDSKGQNIVKNIRYPKSFPYSYNTTTSGVTSSNNNVYLVMDAMNYINYPIEEIVTINGKVVSGKISKYRYYQNTPTSYALFLKKEDLVLDIDKPITNYLNATAGTSYTLPDAGPLNHDNRYRNAIEYKNYDYAGNIVEIKGENGINTLYIWGYNKSYPIAKIEGVEFSSISTSVISNLQTLSDQDTDHCTLSTCKEQLLRNALNNLRNSLSTAMVTTFTYDPSVGLTSVTDPRGNITYFEYDLFGRLMLVKDTESNIISQNEYHYKP